jgi:hypothetical protein
MASPLDRKMTSFIALQTINEERSTHGLRYGDYTRYRFVNTETNVLPAV